MAIKHFKEQMDYANQYLIPYLSSKIDFFENKKIRILDVGCAEGGSILALTNKGYLCDGIEIEKSRADIAKSKTSNSSNIFNIDLTIIGESEVTENRYDIIIMRDVIEHIYDKKTLD